MAMPYHHFSTEERDALQAMVNMKLPKWAIAVILGKRLSSIYRELGRNSNSGVYTSREAQIVKDERRAETKPKPKMANERLMAEVMEMFKKEYSPDQIAGRLAEKYPDDPEMRVSAETIYGYVYEKAGQDQELRRHFRHPRPYRQKRGGKTERRGQIPGRVGIENRPAAANEQKRAGDWEGDTVEGAGKSAYRATFVDRATKLLLAKWMPNKRAVTLNKAAARAFRDIPADFKQTLTRDNGKEFAGHIALSHALDCPIYFARPYHSWERGLHEHTNGLLRQYLPKGTSFDALTQSKLDKIVQKINNRPRKSLGYRTPNEVFFEQKFALQI
jgi:IS30 family transposase